ncbi:IS66 family transposase, partial [Thiolapillus sp.]|uniref:IS66 family transposase n=1 Tax=Thiolapillus sp. TaxID=2017437 RepID=UPI003AF94D24
MTGRRVRRPTLFSLWRKARRENSAASRLLGSTSLRFALHAWQRVCRENGLTRIGCWDHARRKFVEASQAAPAKKKGTKVSKAD